MESIVDKRECIRVETSMPCNHIQPLDFSLDNVQSLNRQYWELRIAQELDCRIPISWQSDRNGQQGYLPTKFLGQGTCRLLEPSLMFVLVDRKTTGSVIATGGLETYLIERILSTYSNCGCARGFEDFTLQATT